MIGLPPLCAAARRCSASAYDDDGLLTPAAAGWLMLLVPASWIFVGVVAVLIGRCLGLM